MAASPGGPELNFLAETLVKRSKLSAALPDAGLLGHVHKERTLLYMYATKHVNDAADLIAVAGCCQPHSWCFPRLPCALTRATPQEHTFHALPACGAHFQATLHMQSHDAPLSNRIPFLFGCLAIRKSRQQSLIL